MANQDREISNLRTLILSLPPSSEKQNFQVRVIVLSSWAAYFWRNSRRYGISRLTPYLAHFLVECSIDLSLIATKSLKLMYALDRDVSIRMGNALYFHF